jgi:glutamate dehydrogenase
MANTIDFLRHKLHLNTETPANMNDRIAYINTLNDDEKILSTIANSIRVTNAFKPSRTSLCISLDPKILIRNQHTPYSILCLFGDHYYGFHVRFRKIARGGLRIVSGNSTSITPASLLQECFDLSYTQHLKNKDIPESGSKGIIYVHQEGSMDDSIKQAVESILDCTVPYNDLLYLGPDEQITNKHINQMVDLAIQKKHPAPRTFITSKMELGFNHKALGVTSESVETFMFHTMRKMSFPRTKLFTVKITGGPDGDVAGNMLRILYREYGEWCRIVGIADGTATCENEKEGISWCEILRLVRENRPLCHFNTSQSNTILRTITDGHQRARDTMHERIRADVFIPAGGRPSTVNETNYMNVAKTTKLIVEGANLFISPLARDKITKEFQVPIIKDSSANKGGVICSSMEVLASMLLTEDEIRKFKQELDDAIIEHVKFLAKREAYAILNQYPQRKDLHRVSEEISSKILSYKDEIYDKLCNSRDEITFMDLDTRVKQSLPPIIVSLGWHRIRTHIPIDYARMMVASHTASNLVYSTYSSI